MLQPDGVDSAFASFLQQLTAAAVYGSQLQLLVACQHPDKVCSRTLSCDAPHKPLLQPLAPYIKHWACQQS